MKTYTITATCTFGLESVLKREIQRLGYEIAASSDGAVSIEGTIQDVDRLNLWLRTANRVLLPVAEFSALTFDELFDGTNAVHWEEFLPKDAKFNVAKISCVKSNLFSKSDCQSIIKKAAVERLKQVHGLNRMPESGADFPLFATIKNNRVSLSINTSGESLHRRGYRLSAGEAPIKETLAAGIIYLSGYDGSQQFADIMCGSGTFVTEAAMMASHTPPGLHRKFAFEAWGWHDDVQSLLLREEAKAAIAAPELRLLGSDIDAGVLKSARDNAKRAGVEEYVAFQKLDFREFRSRKKYGILIVNPPYGERIGEKKETERIYRDLKTVYDELDSWRLFVLSGNEDFQKQFGMKATKNRKLFNGNMLTYLYQYFPERAPREREKEQRED
ncbi:MAG: class I SAM-dependent RNA methyltransferase [Anaerofustis sp.]